jgi:hypothetical protein
LTKITLFHLVAAELLGAFSFIVYGHSVLGGFLFTYRNSDTCMAYAAPTFYPLTFGNFGVTTISVN